MSPVGITRDERARMRLALQALSFQMKGRAVTDLERGSLADAVAVTTLTPLDPAHKALREAAIACLAVDPLTDDCIDALRGAVSRIRTPKSATRQNSARVLKPEPEQNSPRLYWLEGNMA